jgi:deoxycytidylate deaminase
VRKCNQHTCLHMFANTSRMLKAGEFKVQNTDYVTKLPADICVRSVVQSVQKDS